MNFKSNTMINQLRNCRYCWSLTDAIYIASFLYYNACN